MMTEASGALASWQSFYVIVGSSGGALIGLQFVVITLIADRYHGTTPASLHAFGTPTVVHLAGALVVSAIMSAPWPGSVALSIALLACGIGGLAYGGIVFRRARRQTDYPPVWDDWVWYSVLPSLCYAALAGAAVTIHADPARALFIIAAAALALLLTGIRNAWDSVTHVVLSTSGQDTPRPPDHRQE